MSFGRRGFSSGVPKPKVVVIAGPTCVGKSYIAERVCASCDGEIVSADSVQVYRGLDIGSAKPSLKTLERIPHHLINTRETSEEFDAGDFTNEVLATIADINARGKTPVVVGGTSFYIEWLLYGQPEAPKSSPEASARAQAVVDDCKGNWSAGVEVLSEVDPVSAQRINRNDWYRLARALEVWYATGSPLSSFDRPATPRGRVVTDAEFQEYLDGSPFDFRCYFVLRSRERLKRAIDARCEAMMGNGLVSEVVQLVKEGKLGQGYLADKSIGYRQALDMLSKWPIDAPGRDPEAFDERLILLRRFLNQSMTASRKYSRKQIAFFRQDRLFNWMATHNPGDFISGPSDGELEELDRIASSVEFELSLDQAAFHRERSGDGLAAEDIAGFMADAGPLESSPTGRLISGKDQKRLNEWMRKYMTRYSLFGTRRDFEVLSEELHAEILDARESIIALQQTRAAKLARANKLR